MVENSQEFVKYSQRRFSVVAGPDSEVVEFLLFAVEGHARFEDELSGALLRLHGEEMRRRHAHRNAAVLPRVQILHRHERHESTRLFTLVNNREWS